jgi:hypothetical protein
VIEDSHVRDVSPLERIACSRKLGVLLEELKDPVTLSYSIVSGSLRRHSRKSSRLFWRKRDTALKAPKMRFQVQLDERVLNKWPRSKAPMAFL